MKSIKPLFFLLSSAISVQLTAQTVLIGPTTANGSFEDSAVGETPSGWGTFNFNFASTSITTEDAANPGPTQGSKYALFEATSAAGASGTDRTRTENRFNNADSANGTTFNLSFDVRNPDTNGFNSVLGEVLLYNGSTLQDNILTSLGSITTTWTEVSTEYVFSSSLTFDRVDLRIEFRKNSTAGETTYSSYLDNVTLTQVPEPGTYGAILGTMALALVVLRKRSRGSRS